MTLTTPRDQLYYDIFVTAMEGGINYWSEAMSYHIWKNEGHRDGDEDVLGFYARVIDVEADDPDHEPLLINRSTIARGYGLAAGDWRKKIHWSSGEPPPLFIDDDTDWDFDAGDADTIVQLGLGLIDSHDRGDGTTTFCVRYG